MKKRNPYLGKWRITQMEMWEYRILVIPNINEEEIESLCCFIADIDANLPVCFLAFWPNYVLEHHLGASAELMDRCVNIANNSGLKKVKFYPQNIIIRRTVLKKAPKEFLQIQLSCCEAALVGLVSMLDVAIHKKTLLSAFFLYS